MGGRNKTQNEGQSEVLVFGVILVCRTTVIEFFQSDRSWERVWPKVSVCQATFSPCICLIHKNSVFHDLHDKIKKYIHIYTQLSYYPLRIEHCFTEIKFCNLYIYIYIYIYILAISTALMRPRRPKQYCLQLVKYIYIYRDR